jgi:hypothetical protein
MVQCHGFEEPLDTYFLKGLDLELLSRAPEIFEEAVSSRES